MPNESSNFTTPDTDMPSKGYQDPQPKGTGDHGEYWDPVLKRWVPAQEKNMGPGGASSTGGKSLGTGYDPLTGMVHRVGSPGQVSDPHTWGGFSATVTPGGALDEGASGRSADVERYRGIGRDAANREAYQLNWATADKDRALAAQTRRRQLGAVDALGKAALGGAPSQAEIQGGIAMDQSLAAQAQALGGARGGATNQGALTGRVMGTGREANLGIASHFTGARSAEMGRDLAGYTAGAGAVRSGDYTAQDLVQDRQKEQLRSELAQRGLNQEAQLGYENMAFDVNKAAQDAGLSKLELDNQIYANASAAQSRAADRNMGFATGLASSFVNSGAGSLRKREDDERRRRGY